MKPLNIKLSVVVLTYNQESTIRRTLDSIINQKTRYNYEIVIGEDCSTDNTRQICEQYAIQYADRVRLVPKGANKGILCNFKDTIAMCQGAYVAQCAGDDWWHNPNKIELQLDFLEQNSAFGMVHSDIDLFNATSGRTIKGFNHHHRRTPPMGNYAPNLLTQIIPIYTPTPCYRRSLINMVDFGLFVEQGWLMEDLPMWLEMSRYTLFGYIDQSLATYTAAPISACRPQSLEKHLNFEQSVTQVQLYYRQRYFADIASAEAIVKADIYRKMEVYRRFGLHRKVFEYYQMIDLSNEGRLRRLSQKSYLLYSLLSFGKKMINKIR